MGVEVSRSPVATNTKPTFSRGADGKASLPHLQGESKEDLETYTQRHPPTRVTRLEHEVNWELYDQYRGKYYFSSYRESYIPYPLPEGTKVLQYWDLPDGRTIGRWHWEDMK